MTENLILKGGTVYDPMNKIDGEVMDICVSDGKIVDKVPESAKSINLGGKTVMAGGVDLHSHILGSKVNVGRMMSPENSRYHPYPATKKTRSGVSGIVPSSYSANERTSTNIPFDSPLTKSKISSIVATIELFCSLTS